MSGDNEKSAFDRVREVYQREVQKDNFIREKDVVEKARGSLGGKSGEARDHIDDRVKNLEKQIKDQTGE